MLRTVLLILSMSLSLGIYAPFFQRVIKRKHTRDYSKMSQFFVVVTQVNGFALATAEHAHYIQVYYIAQTILTSISLWLIYHYWNADEPRFRGNKPDNSDWRG